MHIIHVRVDMCIHVEMMFVCLCMHVHVHLCTTGKHVVYMYMCIYFFSIYIHSVQCIYIYMYSVYIYIVYSVYIYTCVSCYTASII